MSRIKVAVIGASGYTGLELIKMLVAHPFFEISYLGVSEESKSLISLHPALMKVADQLVEKTSVEDIAQKADLAFLAVPHQKAMELAKPLIGLGVKVVDLSADYRLKIETYEKHYTTHTDQANLANAVYGMPEIYANQLRTANLVANPGCYPTAALLALLPFARYIDNSSPIIVDAKSGVSGAGKKCSETTHFVTINENSFIYNPIAHRHAPEIEEKIEIVSGASQQVVFVPHLLPVTRGMLASVYITIKDDIDEQQILRDYYKDSEFTRVRANPVDIKSVSGTHFADVFVRKSGKTLLIGSAIDNLLRGASSAAVANANIMMNLPKDAGLPLIAYVP